jgi:hypothetical protein
MNTDLVGWAGLPPTGEALRPGHSDELYADPDAPPVKPG